MGQTEIVIFIVLTSIIIALFFAGVGAFFVQYRKKKRVFDTERNALVEAHREQLLQTQLEIQTQTMQHIGREIHDNVGQKLTLASLYNSQLDGENLLPQQKEKIEKISSIINESLAELRSLSKSLTSTYIAETPLVQLLTAELDKVQSAAAINIERRVSINKPQPALVKTILLRIVQEFLQNSLKHARCKNIIFELKEAENGLLLSLTDDGAGFNTNDKYKGIGLYNMKRRAEIIGATLTLKSEPGNGTSLSLLVPLNPSHT